MFVNNITIGCYRDELKDEGASDGELLTSTGGQSSTASTMQQQHQQYLGDVDVILQNFPEIDWGSTPIPGVVYGLCYYYDIKLFVYFAVLSYNSSVVD